MKVNFLKNSSITNCEKFDQEYENKTYEVPVSKGTIQVLFYSDQSISLRGYHITLNKIVRKGNILLHSRKYPL